MKAICLPALTIATIVGLSACEKKPQVVEKPVAETQNFETGKLGTTIDAYISSPTATNAAAVERAFADLDGEIAELDQRLAQNPGSDTAETQRKAGELRTYRDKEKLRYTEALARAKAAQARESAQGANESVKDAAEKVGEGVKDAAESVKDGVENAVDAVKEKLP